MGNMRADTKARALTRFFEHCDNPKLTLEQLSEICGISLQTAFRWKKKYRANGTVEALRSLKELHEAQGRLFESLDL